MAHNLFESQFILYFGFPAKPSMKRIMEELLSDNIIAVRFGRTSIKVSAFMEQPGQEKVIENEIMDYCHRKEWNIEKAKVFSSKFIRKPA